MKNGINVLSLFDGMSCGRIALEKAGIKVNKYFASEIDKYAIKVSKNNYPDINQMGDVKDIKFNGSLSYGKNPKIIRCEIDKIDLLIGGSPCQGFSRAGKGLNFEDTRSKLFFEFVRILKEVKPKYFLLENVNMKKEWEDIITDILGVQPVKINSKLFLPHNRPRTYWSNIPFDRDIKQKKYKLSDYLDKNIEKYDYINENLYNSIVLEKKSDHLLIKNATKKGYLKAYPGYNVNISFPNSKTRRGRVKPNYIGCLTTKLHEAIVTDDLGIRLLNRHECELMQGVRRGYGDSVSDSKIKKMLGDGWTIEVIMQLFKPLKSIFNIEK